VLAQNAAGFPRLFAASGGEVNVGPAGKPVFLIPNAFSVA
jgi:hypothetical protein